MKTPIRIAVLIVNVSILLLSNHLKAEPRLWGETGVPVFLNGAVEWDRTVARNEDGSVLVAWSDMHTGNREIFVQLILEDGTPQWPEAGMQITLQAAEQSFPCVTATAGGWIISWIDYRNRPRDRDPEVGGTGGGELWSQKMDLQGNLLWTENGVVIDSSSEMIRQTMQISPDALGGAVITWIGYSTESPSYDLYMQRVTNSGAPAWTSPAVIANPVNEYETVFTFADDSGETIAVWTECLFDAVSSIHAARVASDGQLAWTTEVVGSNEIGHYYELAACSDRQGGCYVAWSDYTNQLLGNNIHAQRLNSAGELQWGDDGVQVCSAVNTQSYVVISSSRNGEGNDGCLLAWWDMRESSPYYYAQKLGTTGTAIWTNDGVRLFEMTNTGNKALGVTTDGEGGLIAVGRRDRIGANGEARSELRAVRRNANGQNAWWMQTMPVSSAEGDQTLPVVVSLPGTTMVVFKNGQPEDGQRDLVLQKLNNNSGECLLTTAGTKLVASSAVSNNYEVFAVPMSEGRTGILRGNSACFRIVDNAGQQIMSNDSCLGLPNSNYVTSVLSACSDGDGGFFTVLESVLSDVHSYYLSRCSNTAEITRNGDPIIEIGQGQVPFEEGDLQMSPDGTGGCYVLYFRRNFGGLFVLRLDATCHRVWNDPLPINMGGVIQDQSRIVSVPDRGIVAWRSSDETLRLTAFTPERTIPWTRVLCNGIQHPIDPDLVADGSRGVYCAWTAGSNPDAERKIRLQRISADGTVSWDSGGVSISDRDSRQFLPDPTVDQGGNVFVVWTDQLTNGTITSLYAQKYDPEGNRLWGEEGLILAENGVYQGEYSAVPDGFGGLFAAWLNVPGWAYTYALGTHVTSEGVVGTDPFWIPAQGGCLSDIAAYVINTPLIVSNSNGGAVVIWKQDVLQSASHAYHVMAQRIVEENTSLPELSPTLPTVYALEQNFPNPFNPSTEITFSVPQSEVVTLKVFDILGRDVTTLVNRRISAGRYSVIFDAGSLPSGIYVYRLQSDTYDQSRKMVLVK